MLDEEARFVHKKAEVEEMVKQNNKKRVDEEVERKVQERIAEVKRRTMINKQKTKGKYKICQDLSTFISSF